MKKYLSFVLLLVGVLLLGGAGFAAWQAAHPQAAANVPQMVAGLALAQTTGGQAGVDSIQQLHGLDLPVQSGTVATYGQNEATLWLADAGSETAALDMVKNMEAKIAAGNSPFKPMGVYQFQNRDVYLLSGMNQLHFYGQSGSRIFWMSITSDKAEEAVKELLNYYP